MVQINRTDAVNKLIQDSVINHKSDTELVNDILKYTGMKDKPLMQILYEKFNISYTIRGK